MKSSATETRIYGTKELEINYFPKWKSNDRGRGRSLPGGMPQHSIR